MSYHPDMSEVNDHARVGLRLIKGQFEVPVSVRLDGPRVIGTLSIAELGADLHTMSIAEATKMFQTMFKAAIIDLITREPPADAKPPEDDEEEDDGIREWPILAQPPEVEETPEKRMRRNLGLD